MTLLSEFETQNIFVKETITALEENIALYKEQLPLRVRYHTTILQGFHLLFRDTGIHKKTVGVNALSPTN